MFKFWISENKPPVQVLRLHLKDEQNIVLNHGEEELGLEQGRLTELTAFFLLNNQQNVLQQDAFQASNMPRVPNCNQRVGG